VKKITIRYFLPDAARPPAGRPVVGLSMWPGPSSLISQTAPSSGSDPPNHRQQVSPVIAALFLIAAAVISTPIIAAVLVSLGSRREDSAWTLAEPAPGPVQANARRIVGFHSRGIEWLQGEGGHIQPDGHKPGGGTAGQPSKPEFPGPQSSQATQIGDRTASFQTGIQTKRG
jgi:hypothetical protein